MKTIKIFIASSDELRKERCEIADMLLDINRPLKSFGYKVEQSKWEYLDASMGPLHKQEEYNKELKTCELCMVMFWRKFGEYTESELNTAYTELCAGRNPKKLYVYFKDADTITPELNALKNEFSVSHNLAYRAFNSIDSLRVLFLHDILNYCKIEVGNIATLRDNKLLLDGYVYADIRNLPCDHDDYQFLKHFQKCDNVPVYNTDLKLKATNIKGDIITSKDKNKTATVRVFIASSEEVRMERVELIDMLEELNIHLAYRGIKIETYKSQYTNSEDEYRKELSNSELCLVLYWTKFGNYSKADFDAAYAELCAGQNPKKIYVFFKDVEPVTSELQKFKTSFDDRYGHFYGKFQNVDTMRLNFLLQFEMYQSQAMKDVIKVRDSKVEVDGHKYVDLQKVPFCGNNQEYLDLLTSIAKAQARVLKYPDEPDFRQELHDLQEKREKMESSLLDTAKLIAKLSESVASARLAEAIRLFERGDNKGANAVLNLEDIYHDAVANAARIDQTRELGEASRNALEVNVDEFLLKIKALKSRMAHNWLGKVAKVYDMAVHVARNHISKEKFAKLLYEYSVFLIENKQYHLVGSILDECLVIYREFAFSTSSHNNSVAETLSLLGVLRLNQRDYDVAERCFKESLRIFRSLALEKKNLYEFDIAWVLKSLGSLHNEQKDYASARKEYSESLKISRRLVQNNFDVYAPVLAYILNSYAVMFNSRGKYSKAIRMCKESLDIFMKLSVNHPERYDGGKAGSLVNIGNSYASLKKYSEAKKAYAESLNIYKSLVMRNPQLHNPNLAIAYYNLGDMYHRTKEYNKAKIHLSKSLDLHIHLSSKNSDKYSFYVAWALTRRGIVYKELCDFSNAEKDFNGSINVYNKLVSKVPLYKIYLVELIFELCDIHFIQGKYSLAEQELNKSWSLLQEMKWRASGYPKLFLKLYKQERKMKKSQKNRTLS